MRFLKYMLNYHGSTIAIPESSYHEFPNSILSTTF